MNIVEKQFKISENNTKMSKEIINGILIFLPLIYILPVISSTLASVGIDENGAFIATAISTGFACIFAGIIINKPIIQSVGLGMNAFFVYNICNKMGYSPEGALTIIFISSIIFLLFSITNIRKKIILSIPNEIRLAITIGLGAFLIYSGLKSAGLIVEVNNKLSIANYDEIMVILFILGVIVTYVFSMIKKVSKYSIIIGIAFVAVVGYILHLFGINNTPTFTNAKISFASLSKTVFNFDFSVLSNLKTYIVIIVFTLMNVFDTSTGILALHSELGLDSGENDLVIDKKMFLTDSISSIISISLGTTSITTYAETKILCNSDSKTGLSSVTIGILFILSIFLYPIFTIFSGIMLDGQYYYPITSVGVVSVGIMLLSRIKDIERKNVIGVISTVATVITMIIFYSIPDGVGVGIILYVILELLFGKIKEVSKVMIILSVVFVIYFVTLIII